MKSFNNFLHESILDPEQSSLSSVVFDLNDEPKLKDSVRDEILTKIAHLGKTVDIIDYTLIGSILTRRFANDSDIDINVLVSASDEKMNQIRKTAVELSGDFLSNTTHPINLHVLNDKADYDNSNNSADGVFDISNNKFVRKPIEKPFHIEKYMKLFKDAISKIDILKDELKDDIVDYNELKHFSKDDMKSLQKEIESKIKEIESDAQGLVDLYDNIKKQRADGFARSLSASEIRQYGVKNRLPGNVLYKLLERHLYLNFLHKIQEILGDDEKLSSKEIDQLDNLVKTESYSL
jgi:hypothetical protein